MSQAIFNTRDIIKLDNKDIQDLKQKAFNSSLKSARLCLHKSIQESLHEMIIAICKGVYIKPHKHKIKTESFHVIEGSFFLIVFDDSGKIVERILMGGDNEEKKFLCRLEKNLWHMLIPISDFVIFHETTNGPYIGKEDSIFASWAPKKDDREGIKNFIKKILNRLE